jgi:predicted amidophosphoribosyltransferase
MPIGMEYLTLIKGKRKMDFSDYYYVVEKCWRCGEKVYAEDTGRPIDSFYCDCGNSWSNLQSYQERMIAHADYRRMIEKDK